MAYNDFWSAADRLHSRHIRPLGERAWGYYARWSNPDIDEIIDEMKATTPGAPRMLPLSIELLKILVEEMPGFSVTHSVDPYTVDEYYWTGWPSAENPYVTPFHHFPTFKYLLMFLEPTGR